MYELKVEGMTCGGCASRVTKAIKSVDNNAEVNVDLKVSGHLTTSIHRHSMLG